MKELSVKGTETRQVDVHVPVAAAIYGLWHEYAKMSGHTLSAFIRPDGHWSDNDEKASSEASDIWRSLLMLELALTRNEEKLFGEAKQPSLMRKAMQVGNP